MTWNFPRYRSFRDKKYRLQSPAFLISQEKLHLTQRHSSWRRHRKGAFHICWFFQKITIL